jgi:hypothetical protein
MKYFLINYFYKLDALFSAGYAISLYICVCVIEM